jgi:hypothetical protein
MWHMWATDTVVAHAGDASGGRPRSARTPRGATQTNTEEIRPQLKHEPSENKGKDACSARRRLVGCGQPLKLQASLTRTVRERLDAAMVGAAIAVKVDLLDALGERSLGKPLADHRRRGAVPAQLLAHLRLHRGARGKDAVLAIIDDLAVDVVVGPAGSAESQEGERGARERSVCVCLTGGGSGCKQGCRLHPPWQHACAGWQGLGQAGLRRRIIYALSLRVRPRVGRRPHKLAHPGTH